MSIYFFYDRKSMYSKKGKRTMTFVRIKPLRPRKCDRQHTINIVEHCIERMV